MFDIYGHEMVDLLARNENMNHVQVNNSKLLFGIKLNAKRTD